MQVPTAFNAQHYPMTDNTSDVKVGDMNSTAQVNLSATNLSLDNMYAWNGPTQGYIANEDSRFYYKAYQVKIAPTTDGSTSRLRRGDICYSCYTAEDMSTGNDIYTLYSVSRLNKGAFQKMLTKKKTAEDPNSLRTKRARGNNYALDNDRHYQLFPSDVKEFITYWNWAGILQQKIPDDQTILQSPAVNSISYDNVFRLASLAIGDRIKMGCVVSNYVKTTRRIWEVGSMVDRTVERLYDVKGRTTDSMARLCHFNMSYTCTDNDSSPALSDYTREIETEIDIDVSDVSLLNRTEKYNFAAHKLVGMKTRAMAVPYIRPFGYIAECEGPIPTAAEVSEALFDEIKYRQLMDSSPITVQLMTQGWGPFNCRS